MATLRLGELLINEGLITPSQLESALTAQHVFGGRLGTNMVEQGIVSEEDLARVLSKQLGIRVVRPHEVASIDAKLLALIPPDVARKYSVIPFGYDAAKDRVSLAIADPGNLQKIDEIQFAMSRKVDFAICPEVMLAWALERYFGVERARRYIKVAGLADSEIKLDSRDRPAASASRPAPQLAKGALPKEEMLRRIVDAPTKKDLVATTVDLLAGACGQLVFFVVKGDELLAWDTRGLAVSEETLRGTTLSIASSALAREALEACRHARLPRIEDTAMRAVLQDGLSFDCGKASFLLPLIVNRKGFGLCVMTDLAEPFEAQEALLVELMKRVACKLQIFFLTEYLSAPL